MSLSAIGSITATPAATAVEKVSATTTGGGALPFATGATAAGGYMAQGSGAPGSTGGSLLKKMLVGGVVGAGVGFGATFIHPLMAIFTSTTPVGWGIKAAAAGIGAAVGAGGALVMHMLGKRKENLAMQAAGATPDAMAPTAAPAGVTLRTNAKGGAATKLQADLRALGLYSGKTTNTYDSATATALRKYEVLKGVQPTGLATEEARDAISADAKLVKANV